MYTINVKYNLVNFRNPCPVLLSSVVTDDDLQFDSVRIDYNHLTTGKKFYSPKEEYRIYYNACQRINRVKRKQQKQQKEEA